MTLKKFVTLMFALTLVFAMACGKGHEAAEHEDEGEDDHDVQTTTTADTAAGAPAAAAAAPAVADAATLAGAVKFEGAPAKPATLQMSADPFCASQHQGGQAHDEDVVVGPGGELANVLVFVKNAPGNYPPPATPAVLDQRGCKYYPHVGAIQVGQKLQIKNSDATLHNVHAMPEVNRGFNEGQPVQGMVSTKQFDKAEVVPFRIKCDVHGWMKSYLAVLPHPFYSVSQANGQFSIGNLPPGSYSVVAWHEKYGQQEQQVTVGPKESKQIAFTFKG